MVGLITRLKLAWKCFRLKPFDATIGPYHIAGTIIPGTDCDLSIHYNKGMNAKQYNLPTCKDNAVLCISKTYAHFEITANEHLHVCERHAKEFGVTENK